MRTPAYAFVASQVHEIDLAIPGGDRLAGLLCTPAQRTRGPAVMLGFVKDPDSQGPARGAKVQLVFDVTDIVGRKSPVTREATADSVGLYKICGLPAEMSGKVQVYRNGVSSGEVPVEVTNNVALRAFSIVAKHQAVSEVKNDSGKVVRRIIREIWIERGRDRVCGAVGQDRVTVGLGFRDEGAANSATGTGAVLDNDALTDLS
jgi:hypothetical protein